MKNNNINFVLVAATKDRPQKLKNLLESIQSQTLLPTEIIIVDGGDKSVDYISKDFKNLNIKYMQLRPPSGTKQRNLGIKSAVSADLIGIIDDDIVLEKKAIENMLLFWERAPQDLGGAAFNLMNHPNIFAESMKIHPISEKLGLYSKKRGAVLPSGFHTLIGKVEKIKFVDWLPSTAVVYRKKVFEEFLFDEWYKGYSYLEDLDFSYTVGKKYKLAVVPNARYYHFSAHGGRGNGFEFGEREVLNRFHFVRKHKELSSKKCFLALIFRKFISLWVFLKEKDVYFLNRALGNILGFIKILTNISN